LILLPYFITILLILLLLFYDYCHTTYAFSPHAAITLLLFSLFDIFAAYCRHTIAFIFSPFAMLRHAFFHFSYVSFLLHFFFFSSPLFSSAYACLPFFRYFWCHCAVGSTRSSRCLPPYATLSPAFVAYAFTSIITSSPRCFLLRKHMAPRLLMLLIRQAGMGVLRSMLPYYELYMLILLILSDRYISTDTYMTLFFFAYCCRHFSLMPCWLVISPHTPTAMLFIITLTLYSRFFCLRADYYTLMRCCYFHFHAFRRCCCLLRFFYDAAAAVFYFFVCCWLFHDIFLMAFFFF